MRLRVRIRDVKDYLVGDITHPRKVAGPKLILLKVPHVELRNYRQNLITACFDFLLWDWNCVSATICHELMDKNKNEGIDLRGNPLLWTVKHWTHVLGPCAGKEGDYIFKKKSVRVKQAVEFTFAQLFKNLRLSTNGWRTVEYCDPKRRSVATAVMHILKPKWQVGFIERSAMVGSSLSKNLLEPGLDKCRQKVGHSLGESYDAFLGEFLSRDGLVDKEQGEQIFQGKGGLGVGVG